MVLATKSLSMLNGYKFAGQGMSHEASMLCYTDFFFFNNLTYLRNESKFLFYFWTANVPLKINDLLSDYLLFW